MKRFFAAFLILPAVLVACPQAPTPEVKPPAVAEPFKPTLLGSLTVELGADGKGTSAQFKPSTIQNQTLTPVTESTLTFTALPLQTIDVVTPSQRYLMATFNIASTLARTNLTLVAYAKNGNASGSAFKEIQNFVGGAVNVNNIVPINAMKTSGCPGAAAVCVDNSKADLQIYTRSEIATLTTASAPPNGTLLNAGEGILQYAYVARSSATSRNIAANGTGTVTLALQVPPTEDRGGLAYRYSMTFLVFTDNVARVTESTSEQGTNSGATTRATSFGGSPQIATMCGTSLANQTFIPGVRTVGIGADTAWMGGSFYDDTGTAANVAGIIGNTEKTVTGSSLLLSSTGRFKPLGSAALATIAQNIASATTAAGGNYGITSTGDLTIRPKVNLRTADSFTYQISDGTCTSPNIAATIAAPTDTVWYIDSSVATSGDGRSNSPYKTVTDYNTANLNQVSDYIYVKGNNNTDTATLALKSGQRLIGSGVALVVDSQNLQAAGTAPVITNPVTVPTSGTNIIQGLTFASISSGASFGNLTISSASIVAGAARAINLTGGLLNATLTQVSSSGGANGILISGVSGSLTVTGTGTTAESGGVLSDHTADGISLTISNLVVSLKNMRISTSVRNGVNYTTSSGTSSLKIEDSLISGVSSGTTNNDTGVLLTASGTANATLEVSGSSAITDPATHASRLDNTDTGGITINSTGSAVTNLTVNNTSFRNIVGRAINQSLDTSGASKFVITNNRVTTSGTSNINGFRVDTNSASTSVTHNGRINGNTITFPSVSLGGSNGVTVAVSRAARLNVEIKNNTMTNVEFVGIRGLSGVNGAAGNLQATVSGNNVSGTNGFVAYGIEFAIVTSSSGATLCLNLQNNTSSVSGASAVGAACR
jgi:trimeric autotransporter adhesin